MLFSISAYNCSVFIYSTVAGRKCEINIIVIVIVKLLKISLKLVFSLYVNTLCSFVTIRRLCDIYCVRSAAVFVVVIVVVVL